MIFALSPQRKGRVERTAGNFEDRLVTELHLAGANSIMEANRVLEQFLPRFNQRFRVPPQHPEPAFRPLDPELFLEQVLCFKHRRKVARDNASKHKAMSYCRMKEREEQLSAEVAELLRQAEEVDEEENRRYGWDRRGDGLPEELGCRESRLWKVRESKRPRWRARPKRRRSRPMLGGKKHPEVPGDKA